jgi:endonuclease G
MATVRGRIDEARRALMFGAAQRWQEREEARTVGLDKVSAMGVGAADSPEQRARFSRREALKLAKGIPRFGERTIGTADFIPFAPSTHAAASATPVARLVTMPEKSYTAEGVATGLLMPGQLLLTNYHVFPGKKYAFGYAANFGYLRDERGIQEGSYFELDPDAFFLEDEQYDFVIVSLKSIGLKGERLGSLGGTPLIENTGKILTGMPVNIVQHPGGGPRQFAVSNNRLLDILPAGYLHYETDTERGSSGSPVYNQDWELIALHHCGVPEMRGGDVIKTDGNVWDEDRDPDSEIHWVSNEGTRVSFIVDRMKGKQLETAEQQQRLAALIASTSDPCGTDRAAAMGSTFPSGSATMPNSSFSFSGPVTIHVYATPAPALPEALAVVPLQREIAASGALFAEKSLVFDPDYEAREGYDEKFLGVSVPMPSVASTRSAELYTAQDYLGYCDEYRDVPGIDTTHLQAADPIVLAYHHYSLVMNKTHRMCMWTASNCDYREDARQDGRSGKELGGENWRHDPRVPAELQLSDPDIYQPAKRIDRGHVVRREDNCWGDAGLQTDYANADSFHWTNCTPQHEAFNRENPSDRSPDKVYADSDVRGIWGQFEAELARQIRAGGGRAVLFAGPVLKDFFEPKDWGNGKVRIPKQFWKVVVVPASLKKKAPLLSYGYVFSQVSVVNRFGLSYEAVDLPQFSRQRKPLKAITELTGVIFPAEVLAAEQG